MEQPEGHDTGEVPTDPASIAARVVELEAQLAQLSRELHTARLVIADPDGQERIVAEVVDGAAELRIELAGMPTDGRTGVLVFALPAGPDLPAGIGVQLWAAGDLVRELTWWGDERRSP
jgi:hypothetical protein